MSVGGECECRQQPARRYKTCGRSLELLSRSQPFAVRNDTRCTIPTHTHTHLLPRVAARLCSPVVDVHQRAVEVQLVLSSRIIPRETLRELGRDLNSSYVLPRALNVLAMCLHNGLQMQCCCESRERGEETGQECQS